MAELLDNPENYKAYYTSKKNYALTFVNESELTHLDRFDK